MISVVIPTLDAGDRLAATLSALVPASIDGLVREVIIVDGGSSDTTLQIADDAGARIITSTRGRGLQLRKGGAAAKGPWLLFLHADTLLEKGWHEEAARFMQQYAPPREKAAAFQFALDDEGLKPALLERFVALRCRLFKLPYGDQGLLIAKPFYDQLGGYAEIPLMEDVELVRRIGPARLRLLAARARTSAARFQESGYWRRSVRNLHCLWLYSRGVAPETIQARYER